MAVDDEEDVTFCLSTVLQKLDYLKSIHLLIPKKLYFKPNFYDLVILDIKMPNMDGFEIYEKIKTKEKKSAYVFLQLSLILVITRKYIRI